MAGLTAERMRELNEKKDTPDSKKIEAEKLKKEQDDKSEQDRIEAEAKLNEEKEKGSKSKEPTPSQEKYKPTKEELLAALREEIGEDVDFSQIKARFEKPLTAEEQKRFQEKERADQIKFAVDNQLATPEDILEWQKIQDADEEEIAFNQFARNEKKNNPKVTEAELREMFPKRFFQSTIDEENDTPEQIAEKKRWASIGMGEKKTIAQSAKETAKKKLDKIEREYANHKDWSRKAKEYFTNADSILDELSNTYMVAGKDDEGKEDIPLQVEISKEDRKALETYLRTDGVCQQFVAAGKVNDKQAIKEAASRYIETLPSYKTEMFQAILRKGISIGTERTKIGTTKEIKNFSGEEIGESPRADSVEKLGNLLKKQHEKDTKVKA